MKSLWVTLAVFLLLAPLVSGNWYAPRCANKKGRCRTKCRTREMAASPTVGSCGKKKTCCIKRNGSVPTFCSETTKATNTSNTVTVSQAAGGTPGAEAGPSSAATTTATSSAAAAGIAVASTTTTPANATTTAATGLPLVVASSTATSAAAASTAKSAAAAAAASSAGAGA